MAIYAVTGSASGIGRAVKEQLEAGGHDVISIDLHDAEITADLSRSEDCDAVVKAVQARAPEGLDGLVPCAGVGPDSAKPELIPLVNYFATVALVTGLMPALERRRGSVVLISSNSSQMTEYDESFIQALLAGDRESAIKIGAEIDGQGAYGGGKQALTRWMRHHSEKAAHAGVRMNAIAPGYTETGMTAAGLADPTYGDAIQQFVDSIPIGRPGLPEDQANAVAFLLSDKASFIAGSVLFVDGGHDATFRPDRF